MNRRSAAGGVKPGVPNPCMLELIPRYGGYLNLPREVENEAFSRILMKDGCTSRDVVRALVKAAEAHKVSIDREKVEKLLKM